MDNDQSNGEQPFQEEDNEDFSLTEDDVLQVIDLGDGQLPNVEDEMEDLDVTGEDMDEGDPGEVDHGAAVSIAVEHDDAIACFKSHTDSVFCVRLHPDASLAVSGGQDDTGYVWRTDDCSVVMTCSGHQDSVTCVGFSHDGKYVATGDMGGLVQVWRVSSKELVWSYECGDLEWIQWHPMSPVLLAGTSDGLGWMWRIPSGECKCYQGVGVANNSCTIMPDGKRACFGYANGQVNVWDLKAATCIECKWHSSPINSITAHPDNQLVLACSERSRAYLLDSFTGKLLCKFEEDIPSSASRETAKMEDASFCVSLPYAATGSLTGTLGIWDLPSQSLRLKCMHPDGVIRVEWSAQVPSLVYSACLDGAVRLWDGRSGSAVQKWAGHTDQLLDMCLSRGPGVESIIATASDDHTVRIFSGHKPAQ